MLKLLKTELTKLLKFLHHPNVKILLLWYLVFSSVRNKILVPYSIIIVSGVKISDFNLSCPTLTIHFQDLQVFLTLRVKKKCLHPLQNILVLNISAF